MPKQIIIADSTQITAYCECPSLWLYGYHESLEPSEIGEEKHAIPMGTLGHKWMERYYTAKAMGVDTFRAASFADAFNPDAEDSDADDNHQYPLDPVQRKTVLDRCKQYWMTYSNNDFAPICKEEYNITIDSETGLPVDGIKKIPLVEQGFSYELFNSPEYLFILEGRIDFIAPIGGGNGIGFVDHKFQLRERKLYNKSIQFKNYALATGFNLGVINYIRLHKEVSNKTFQRDVISFNPPEIRAWRGELIEIFINIAKNLKAGTKYGFERRRSSCPGKFGYPCQFTHICEEPSREMGELIKINMYKKKKEWKPW